MNFIFFLLLLNEFFLVIINIFTVNKINRFQLMFSICECLGTVQSTICVSSKSKHKLQHNFIFTHISQELSSFKFQAIFLFIIIIYMYFIFGKVKNYNVYIIILCTHKFMKGTCAFIYIFIWLRLKVAYLFKCHSSFWLT